MDSKVMKSTLVYRCSGWNSCVAYEPTSQKANSQKWSLAVKKVQILPSKPTECAIVTSIGRAVFGFCQESIVAEAVLLES